MRSLPEVGDTFGDYRIEAVLGSGGMGYVYAAVRLRLTRVEALKVLPPHFWDSAEYRARFLREATTLSQLDSPHIVHIYDYGEQDGCPYLSTQLIRDGDLQTLLEAGPLPPRTAVLIARQVASALEDAHSAAVVHRDVKPSNVLVRRGVEPYAYLCDFGIARTGDRGLTTSGAIVGTWSYMAPECCQGLAASPRSDIYSLGCLLWAMLTGEAPYQGSGVEVAMRHLNEPIPQLVGDDEETARLNAVLRRAMAKDPDDRYQSAREMSADLERPPTARHAPTAARAEPRPELTVRRAPVGPAPASPGASESSTSQPPAEQARRRGRAVALAVAATLVAALLGVGTALVLTGSNGATVDPEPTKTQQPTRPRLTPAERQLRLTRVDYNGDDYSDLALQTNGSPGRIFTFVSSGTRLDQRSQILHEKPPPPRIKVHRLNGDFDGDGRTDIAILDVAGGHQDVLVRRGGPDGFGPHRRWGRIEGGKPTASMSGDFDGDGRMDLVHETGTSEKPLSFSVLISTKPKHDTGNRFQPAKGWATNLHWLFGVEKLVAGDFNGDGKTDIAGIEAPDRATTGPIEVALSTGRSFLEPRSWGTFGLVRHVQDAKQVAGDFDGDGRTDLALVVPLGADTTSGAEVLVAINKSDHFARTQHSWWRSDEPGASDSWVAVGSFDGDKRDDIARVVQAGGGGLDIRVLRSNGRSFSSGAAWAHWNTGLEKAQVFTVNRVG